MFAQANKIFVAIVGASMLAACVSTGSVHLVATHEELERNYPQIKQIVVEEAATNGFGTLTSEVKPSKFNNWEGELFFQLNTPNGTDQLFVTFRNRPQGADIWVHGAGTRSNPDSAAKAIAARLTTLNQTGAVPPVSAAPGPTAPAARPAATPNDLSSKAVVAAPEPVAISMSTTKMQQRLTDLGYKPGPVDGNPGQRTTNALKQFQRDHKLAPTGTLDRETIRALNKP